MEIENNNNNTYNNITDGIVLHTTENIINKQELKLYNPTIMLSGHQAEVYTGKFSHEGFFYASAGADRKILLWEVFEEKCSNIVTLDGHTNAVLELVWSQDDSKIFTCSADKTVCIWDIYEGKRLKKLKGHESFVNCVASARRGPELVKLIFLYIIYYNITI
jgi:Prp8 binding protein